jgi:hypothetical protein
MKMKTTNKNTESCNHSIQPSNISQLSQIGLKLTLTAVFLGGLAVSGLSSYASAQELTNTSQATTDHPGWAHLPGVIIRPDCAHEIPKGATVEIGKDGNLTGDVTLNGELIAHYDDCPEKAIVTRRSAHAQGVAQAQAQAQEETGNGWIEDDHWNSELGASDDIDYMGSNWTVPPYPSEDNGQVIDLSNGIGTANYKFFLEAALVYGYNGMFGGHYYSIATFLVGPSSVYYSAPEYVYPGDSLTGFTQMTRKSGSTKYWGVAIVDNSTGAYSAGSYGVSGQHWTFAYRGALQAYNLNACAEFPASPRTVFSDATVYHGFPNFYEFSYPNWVGGGFAYGGPTCFFAVVAASGTLDY